MVRYQVILAYDGTEFLGSQYQARGRTVQNVVEKALRRLQWQGKHILAAGRTDTGVHATGQVIAFDLDWKHPDEELRQALNAYLPEDVVAREVRQVQTGFHPRKHALSRQYRYSIFIQDVRDPLRERYAWRVWPSVDFEVLQQAALVLAGKHDFSAFGSPPRAGGSTVRTVMSAGWRQEGSNLVFEVSADGFLYHMVRRMVFLQVEIGQGRLGREMVSRYLGQPKSEDPFSVVQGLAPPNGLVLEAVNYPERALPEDRI